mmetsp:Transcript_87652/g.256245  ORF Transcript_87652/g.256245 Transcript_87652/m.256245 type:complete len:225 (-) Transcript_87652:52-726(-)
MDDSLAVGANQDALMHHHVVKGHRVPPLERLDVRLHVLGRGRPLRGGALAPGQRHQQDEQRPQDAGACVDVEGEGVVHRVVEPPEDHGRHDPGRGSRGLRVAQRPAVDRLVADLREHRGGRGHDEVATPDLHNGRYREEQHCRSQSLADEACRAEHHTNNAHQPLSQTSHERLVKKNCVDEHRDAGHHEEATVELSSLFGIIVEEGVLQVITSNGLEGRETQGE